MERGAVTRAAFLAGTGAALALGAGSHAAVARSARITLGDDAFVRDAAAQLRGRTVGIVTNPTGALSTGELLVDALARTGGVTVKALFGPEHGIRGSAGAGESVAASVD